MKRKLSIALILIFLILFCIYELFQNFIIDIETINVENTEYNKNLDEIKIANISDIHMPTSKILIDEIVESLEKEKPDVILLTGDIIDRKTDIFNSGLSDFCNRISKIAKCYAVSGNHEIDNFYSLWEQVLRENNIILIENKCEIYEKGRNKIAFLGLKYGSNYSSKLFGDIDEIQNIPKIVLVHNPNKFSTVFSDKNSIIPDYMFSGHAHGGQIRIPIINQGLFAPGQGFLPKFTSGLYEADNGGKMILSRGLGNGTLPIRINDRVHIPILVIKTNN